MIPNPEITDKGIITPTTEEVLQGMWSVLVSALGNDLNQSLNTPQGQLATSLSATIRNRDDILVQALNQFDPRFAVGIWQDAIMELYFLTRQAATASTANLTFYGLVGATIPQGFRVQDQAGNEWLTTSAVTIQAGGSISVTAACSTLGAVYASAETITVIVENLVGVDRVTNLAPAVAGKPEESRVDAEQRRQESVSANAKNTDSSVRGSVANLPTVVDVWVQSNNTAAPITAGATNYTIPLHSILVSVVGGMDYDIAWQILEKAGSGCGFTGNTTITVTDTDALAVMPPQYEIKFLRPANTTVKFKVTFQDASQLSLAVENAVKNAILNALASGRARARIAQNLRAVQYVSSIVSVTDLELISIEVSTDSLTWVDSIQFGVDQFPVCSLADIEVA